MLIPPPPGKFMPLGCGGPIAVEPQPAIKSEETAIATLTRAIATVLLADLVGFMVVGLADM
jgi:hypothetical protein